MVALLNFVLFNAIFFLHTFSPACHASNASTLSPEPNMKDYCIENLLVSNDPILSIETSFPSRKKGLIGNFGIILGDNPYFCNSFALMQLDYLPPLPMQCDSFSPILSFRYQFADTKAQGFSVGGGTRFYTEPLCGILGFNLFYDFKSIPCHHFYQIGLGFEYLRLLSCISFLELRANIYMSLNRRFIVRAQYCYYPEEFIAIGTNTFHNPGGWDIELGKRFFYKNIFDLYFSIAPYHLFSQEYGIEYGGSFRWKSALYGGIRLYQNISYSTTDIVGFIGINIPLDRECICDKNVPIRIPFSRWETIKLQSCINWKTNY